MDELKREIEKETALLHQKESQILDFQKKLTEQTHEIGRLNTVVSQTRTELTLDRKRHESEFEESSATKEDLEHQISDLMDADVELEAQVLDLQHRLRQVTAAHTSATEKCDKLTLTVSKLEKELKLWKGVIVQHDKADANTQAHMVDFQGHVQSLENAKIMLQRECDMKDELIEEMEDKLKDAKKDVEAKEKIIHGLHARILDLDRYTYPSLLVSFFFDVCSEFDLVSFFVLLIIFTSHFFPFSFLFGLPISI